MVEKGNSSCVCLQLQGALPVSCYTFLPDQRNNLWIGIIAFIIATTSHAGSLVFYDAYLPIALPEHRDKISARGYAFGYIGSVLLLIVNLLVIQKPEWFGISSENHLPVRLAFLSVGIWWFSFSQYSFIRLPEDQNVAFDKSQLFGGLKKLKTAWNHIRHNRDVMYFLFLILLL